MATILAKGNKYFGISSNLILSAEYAKNKANEKKKNSNVNGN